MVKIIETNISLCQQDIPQDCQSRVIEHESWESYLDEIKNGESKDKYCIIGSLYGRSKPKICEVEILQETNHSAIFRFETPFYNALKTAYLVNSEY